jgi:hypothetical protein
LKKDYLGKKICVIVAQANDFADFYEQRIFETQTIGRIIPTNSFHPITTTIFWAASKFSKLNP